jgi:pyruvate/2-oxoacid:ferredoxin oxidoreductase alpha subunit
MNKSDNNQIVEGSHAVAEIVKNLRPAVVAAYPITPQTHIVEDLAKMKDNGEADFEFINAESEFSAASMVLGASATGVRTYTATSSQGLLLMTEVLFNIAGMRLPVVITCANRAISSPINIWCFNKDAKVLMADLTYKSINEVKAGDFVLGKDKKGNLKFSKVTKLFERYTDNLLKLETDKFNLICTPDHLFYERNGLNHWTKAINLKNKKLHWFGYDFGINKEFKRGWLAGVADGDGSFYSQGNRYSFRLKVKDEEMVDTFVSWANEFEFKVRKVNYLEKEGYYIAIFTITTEVKEFKKFLDKTNNFDFYRGYLAGMFDAEGSGPFNVKRAVIYNTKKELVDLVTHYLHSLNIKFKVYIDKRSANYHVKINNVPEFFIACRPVLERKRNNLLRMTLKSVKSRLEILDVMLLNKRTKVFNLETETNNYIVNGFLVHNCDQQDSVTIRDAGWIQLYAETNQETVDLHILAYKLAESLMLPVMVNMDGFVLTHTFESVEIPEVNLIKKFLPDYIAPKDSILDTANPRSLGTFATPERYLEIRQELFNDVADSAREIVKQNSEFKKVFGRGIGTGLIEEYKTKDADIILVAMGSVCGTIKEVIDQLRDKGKKVGLLKIISFRPFPDEEIVKALSKAKYIAVVDKSISIGTEGILATDIKRACYGQLKMPINSFVVGLGGRDITEKMISDIVELAKGKNNEVKFKGV